MEKAKKQLQRAQNVRKIAEGRPCFNEKYTQVNERRAVQAYIKKISKLIITGISSSKQDCGDECEVECYKQ